MYREREEAEGGEVDGPLHCSALPLPSPKASGGGDPDLEHCILGSWNKGRGLKENGLMKKVQLSLTSCPSSHLTTYNIRRFRS